MGIEVSELQQEPLRLFTDDNILKAAKEPSIVLQIERSLSLAKKRLFLICDDCYWCASAIKTRLVEFDSCPQCQRQVSSIPLADNEKYTYNYEKRHGVEVDFWSARQTTVPAAAAFKT